MTRILLLVAVMLWLAPAAGAVDGVLEINQACAVHTGCFSGDDPGLPVTIAVFPEAVSIAARIEPVPGQ